MADSPIIEHVVGLPLDHSGLASFLNGLDPAVDWEDDDGQADWVSHNVGVDVQGDTDRNEVTAIFFFNKGVENHQQCSIDLPLGIEIGWSRSEVVAHLGAPSFGGPSHDSWHHPGFRYIVEYNKRHRILKASLTKA